MLKNLKGLIITIILGFVLINFSSCNKPGEAGLDLVKDNNGNINTLHTDTFTITPYSKLIDTMRTSQLATYLLGSYYDDIFGVTNSSIYTQLRLYNTELEFGTNPQCDSIVLSLVVDKVYGDSTASHNVSVYEMDESIYSDSIYYHFEDKSAPTLVGQGTYVFNTDSVVIDSTTLKPQIRIKLDNSFASKILAKGGQTELSDNDNFLEFMKGLKIEVDKVNSPGSGSIAYLDLDHAQSEMRIFYSNDDDDSLSVGFTINTYCAKYANYDHFDYNEASNDFKNQVLNNDTALGNQRIYLQPLAGIKSFIKFPDIKGLIEDEMVAIHQAEIVFSPESSTYTNDALPNQLVLVRINDDNNDVFLEDYAEGENYFGGDLNNNEYNLNISLYIQKLLTGEINNKGLHLLITGSGVSVNRAVLNGPDAALNPMKLKIIYSKTN